MHTLKIPNCDTHTILIYFFATGKYWYGCHSLGFFNVALLVWLLYPYQGKAAQFSAKDSMHSSHKTVYPTVSFTVTDKDSVWLTDSDEDV